MTDKRPASLEQSVELQHEQLRQLRNVLAAVRSIVRRTGERSDEAGLYAARINCRISAYTYAVSELARQNGVDLAMLVADQLIVYGGHEGESLNLQGETVRLKGKAAGSLALAIHELACNAMEHGALAAKKGKIAISWAVTDRGRGPSLELSWHETDLDKAPLLQEPGFGMDHLLRSLPYETGGHVEYKVEESGLYWMLSVPISD